MTDLTQRGASRTPAMRPRPAGFTLLEVAVAFLIAGLTMAALTRTASTAALSTRVASRTEEAVARAQSHLAALAAAPLVDSDRQGEDGGGFHWRMRVTSAATVHPTRPDGAGPAGAVTLYRLSVAVSWTEDGRRRSVQLDSAQLGPLT